MKVIEIKTKKTDKMYVCEICNTKYCCELFAVNCERRHNCKHNDIRYEFIDSSDDDRRFQTKGIKKMCEYCGYEFEEVLFEHYENQDMLESIYNLIKK